MRLLILTALLASCGQDYGYIALGTGDEGKNVSGPNSGVYTITVDRSATPWSSNNRLEADRDGVVYLPDSFDIPSMTNTDNGGWFDIIVGEEVYCYQGNFGTRTFEFSYKKAEGATTGCDTNSDKTTEAFGMHAAFESGDTVQVIPRAPRYDVIEDFNFPFVGIAKE
jgi:hypothetical protein